MYYTVKIYHSGENTWTTTQHANKKSVDEYLAAMDKRFDLEPDEYRTNKQNLYFTSLDKIDYSKYIENRKKIRGK